MKAKGRKYQTWYESDSRAPEASTLTLQPQAKLRPVRRQRLRQILNLHQQWIAVWCR
jgi:hypothetical protein